MEDRDEMALDPVRQAFEVWFSDGGKWPEAVRRNRDGYSLAQAQGAWCAWRAAWSACESAAQHQEQP